MGVYYERSYNDYTVYFNTNYSIKGRILRYIFASFFIIISCATLAKAKEGDEKHHEDPTKIITKIGAGYTGDFTVSGSLVLDKVRKLNGNVNIDGSEWRLGGSWLFNFGILNFSLGRSEYDDGREKDNYSVGTFLPLKALGVDTGEWMIFSMAGVNHNKIDSFVDEEADSLDELAMQQNTNNGAYLGAMLLRPLTHQWTAMGFLGGGLGSDDYSNLWVGGGASYKINDNQSFNFFGFLADDSYGSTSKLAINYTYEFQ